MTVTVGKISLNLPTLLVRGTEGGEGDVDLEPDLDLVILATGLSLGECLLLLTTRTLLSLMVIGPILQELRCYCALFNKMIWSRLPAQSAST